MLIRRKKGWELPERIATPEARFADRRRLLAGMGIGGLILAAPAAMGPLGPKSDAASRVAPRHSARPDEALASFYPAPRNARYEIDRPLTAEPHATSYNNFYEFGSHNRSRMVHLSGSRCRGSTVFKSVKSIVRLRFTDARPRTFWDRVQPSEYGFWA